MRGVDNWVGIWQTEIRYMALMASLLPIYSPRTTPLPRGSLSSSCRRLLAELPSIDGLWSRPWSFGKREQAFMLQLWGSVPSHTWTGPHQVHAVVIFATFQQEVAAIAEINPTSLRANGFVELRWRTVLDDGYLATST